MLLLTVLVAGCGEKSLQPAPLTAPSLSIGVVTPVATLNPVTMGTSEEANFANFVWAGLLGVNGSGLPFPMLAEQVPTYGNGLISTDGLDISFDLRPGLRWSNGQAITARDVRFGWRLATRIWADVCPATCGVIRNVDVDSSLRVTFQLSKPFAPLLFDLPPVVPAQFIWKGSWANTKRFLFQATSTWFGSRFPVDGPFMVSGAVGSAITMTRNPEWGLLSRPKYASVRVVTYPSDGALLSAVQSGRVQLAQGFNIADIANHVITPGQLGSLRLRFFPTGGIEHLEPNILRGALQDVRVRQALNLDINRSALLKASLDIPGVDRKDLIAYGPEMPGFFDGLAISGMWDPIKNRFVTKPQPADAARLLSEAGWTLKDGTRYKSSCVGQSTRCPELSLQMLIPKTYIDRIHEVQYLQQGPWGRRGAPGTTTDASLGIHTELNFTQWSIGNLIAPYGEHGPCARGRFDFCLFAELPGYDPQTDFQLEFTSSHIPGPRVGHRLSRLGGLTDLNFPGIDDREIDHVFAAAAMTYDLATRRALYRAWQLRVAKQAYWIPLYQQPLIVVQRVGIAHFAPSVRGAEWNSWELGPA